MTLAKLHDQWAPKAARSLCLLVSTLFVQILLVGTANSEIVKLRSGDHASFSRLVLPLSEPSQWSLGRSGNSYFLEVARDDLEFDLAGAFDRIARTRVAALRSARGSSRLEIELGCDCHATAFVYGPAAIVVDLNDGPPPPGSRFEVPIGEAVALQPNEPPPISLPVFGGGPLGFGSLVGQEGQSVAVRGPEPIPTQAPVPSSGMQAVPPVWLPSGLPTMSALTLPTNPGQAPADADTAAAFAARAVDSERLLRELSRATAQGLLQPRLLAVDPFELPGASDASEMVPDSLAAVPSAGAEQISGPELEAPREQEGPPSLRIVAQTSIDRDTGVSRIVRSPGNDAQPCLDDAAFDVVSWGDSDVPEAGIKGLARHRENLVKEFDRPDPKRVIELVRYYLWLGFGAEARSVLQAFEDDIPPAPIEAAMADLVDGAIGADTAVLKGQAGCSGRTALWSLLVEPDGTLPDGLNRSAVVAAFSELPPNLRSVFGQDLARRFLNAGDRGSTIAIRNALARAGSGHLREAELIDARLAVLDGDTSAGPLLDRLATGNDLIAAEALALKIAAGLDRGEKVAGAADSVAGLARTHGGSLPGTDLDRLSVRARIAAGAYDEVRTDLFRRAAGGDVFEPDRALWSEFIGSVTKDASEPTFLRQAFALSHHLARLPIDNFAREAFMARLEDLGFPDVASGLSEGIAMPQGDPLQAGAVKREIGSVFQPDRRGTDVEGVGEAATGPSAEVDAGEAGYAATPFGPQAPPTGREDLTGATTLTREVPRTAQKVDGGGSPPTASTLAQPPDRPLQSEGGVVERAAEALANARAARAAIEQRLRALKAAEPSG